MAMSGPDMAAVTASASQSHRMARYRNLQGNHSLSTLPNVVRKVMTEEGNDEAAQQRTSSAPSAGSGNSIARSMSRYRRRANSDFAAERDGSKNGTPAPKITAPQPSEDSMPPVPTIPPRLRSSLQGRSHISKRDEGLYAVVAPPVNPHRSPPRQHRLRHAERASRQLNRKMAEQEHQSRPSTASEESQSQVQSPKSLSPKSQGQSQSQIQPEGQPQVQPESQPQIQPESQLRVQTEIDDEEKKRQLEENNAKYAAEVARLEAETDRILAEQKKKDLERLQAQLSANQDITVRSHKPPRSPIIEKFASFTKRSKSRDGLSPGLSPTGSIAGSVVDFHASRTNLPEMPKLPAGIEQGGKGIVPQTDAPVSAVNTGDRVVSIRCRQNTFILPVTPRTTSLDIIFSTSKQMSYDLEISPATCIVIEAYAPLGLERRLRKWEHIRDVMNTWDGDTHNQLVVALSESVESDRDLDIESVPNTEEPPRGIQVYMYHSNRPGKWNKRYVTLLDNGQLICSKKPNASTADKETLSLCHLSDYDIYTPLEAQMRKHIKPPKKHCFAIKSQSKPSMFVNTENYVQYFCSEDDKVAFEFYARVHAWRSWYLVDRKPDARRISIPKVDEKPPQLAPAPKHAPKKSFNVASVNGHRLIVSVDETPYTVGEFEPLLDLTRFDKRLSQFGKDFLPTAPDPSTMPKYVPADPKVDSKDGKPEKTGTLVGEIKPASDEAFTGNGLLGEGYEERKAASAAAEKEAAEKRMSKEVESDKFTDGSLLDAAQQEAPAKVESPSWFPSALQHTAKEREKMEVLRPSTSAGLVGHKDSISHHQPYLHGRAPSITRRPLPQTPNKRGGGRPDGRPPQAFGPPPPKGGNAPGMSQSNRRQPPKPLVNLTPASNEPPQWQKKGHGVVVPEGMQHLVDMISVGNGPLSPGGNLLEVPPRSAMRRGPNTAPLPNGSSHGHGPPHGPPPHGPPPPPGSVHRPNGLARTRSKSSGAPPTRPLAPGDFPPVPPLPGRQDGRGRDQSMPRMPPSPRMPQSPRLPPPPSPREPRGVHRDGSMPRLPPPPPREGGHRDGSMSRAPPSPRMPPPSRGGGHREHRDQRDHRDQERRGRERERVRHMQQEYNSVPGRTGTLKVV